MLLLPIPLQLSVNQWRRRSIKLSSKSIKKQFLSTHNLHNFNPIKTTNSFMSFSFTTQHSIVSKHKTIKKDRCSLIKLINKISISGNSEVIKTSDTQAQVSVTDTYESSKCNPLVWWFCGLSRWRPGMESITKTNSITCDHKSTGNLLKQNLSEHQLFKWDLFVLLFGKSTDPFKCQIRSGFGVLLVEKLHQWINQNLSFRH